MCVLGGIGNNVAIESNEVITSLLADDVFGITPAVVGSAVGLRVSPMDILLGLLSHLANLHPVVGDNGKHSGDKPNGVDGTSAASYGAGPQIRNPFPAPGTAAAADPSYDPELAAQIAQWQSAYSGRDAAGASSSTPGSAPSTIPGPDPDAAAAATGDKKKTVVREGGGKKWTDDTLVEWDPSHLRLFVGNLAGEVTDESLLKAFARWPSVAKARVVRDKRTSKSKGFGFVAFSDADDFFQAAKEMNGKYIQSHPVVVRKANTEIKVTNVKEKG
ncbi:hypothetical protein BN1723_017694, partial [Verticillium longisporum]